MSEFYRIKKSTLTGIGDAIRLKRDITTELDPEEMPDEILSINGGSTDVLFPFGGKNAELIDEYSEDWGLEDTDFVIGESASTAATTIKAGVINRYVSPTIAIGDKDIVVVQMCEAAPIHSATANAQQIKFAYAYVSFFSKRKTSDTSSKTTRQIANCTTYINKYRSTSGAITRTVGNYGFYFTPAAPTVASATAASTTVRLTSPTLMYRVSSSYESAANIKLVTECSFKWRAKIYLVDSMSTPVAGINDAIDDALVNGLE